MKLFWNGKDDQPKPKTCEEEDRALDHFRSDIGLNYDAGFGSFLEDSGAADVDRVMKEHRTVKEG